MVLVVEEDCWEGGREAFQGERARPGGSRVAMKGVPIFVVGCGLQMVYGWAFSELDGRKVLRKPLGF